MKSPEIPFFGGATSASEPAADGVKNRRAGKAQGSEFATFLAREPNGNGKSAAATESPFDVASLGEGQGQGPAGAGAALAGGAVEMNELSEVLEQATVAQQRHQQARSGRRIEPQGASQPRPAVEGHQGKGEDDSAVAEAPGGEVRLGQSLKPADQGSPSSGGVVPAQDRAPSEQILAVGPRPQGERSPSQQRRPAAGKDAPVEPSPAHAPAAPAALSAPPAPRGSVAPAAAASLAAAASAGTVAQPAAQTAKLQPGHQVLEPARVASALVAQAAAPAVAAAVAVDPARTEPQPPVQQRDARPARTGLGRDRTEGSGLPLARQSDTARQPVVVAAAARAPRHEGTARTAEASDALVDANLPTPSHPRAPQAPHAHRRAQLATDNETQREAAATEESPRPRKPARQEGDALAAAPAPVETLAPAAATAPAAAAPTTAILGSFELARHARAGRPSAAGAGAGDASDERPGAPVNRLDPKGVTAPLPVGFLAQATELPGVLGKVDPHGLGAQRHTRLVELAFGANIAAASESNGNEPRRLSQRDLELIGAPAAPTLPVEFLLNAPVNGGAPEVSAPPLPPGAAPILEHAAADPGLSVSVLPQTAHMTIASDDGRALELHLRMRPEGGADIRAAGALAPMVQARVQELGMALAAQGFTLGSFEMNRGDSHDSSYREPGEGAGEGGSDRPAGTKKSSDSGTTSTRGGGRIHVKA